MRMLEEKDNKVAELKYIIDVKICYLIENAFRF